MRIQPRAPIVVLASFLHCPVNGFSPGIVPKGDFCVKREFANLAKQTTNLVLGFWLLSSSATFAADYAGMDIAGQDFSGSNFAGKDFSSVNAKGTNFHNSNLQGCLFTKSNLVGADFSGADIRGAHFEDTTLDGASFKDANAQKAVFSATILDIAVLENIDLTDSIWPSKLQIMICDMPELKGENAATGVDSRRSILCR